MLHYVRMNPLYDTPAHWRRVEALHKRVPAPRCLFVLMDVMLDTGDETVTIAVTPEEVAELERFAAHLPQGRGSMFIYEPDARHAFWFDDGDAVPDGTLTAPRKLRYPAQARSEKDVVSIYGDGNSFTSDAASELVL